MREDIRLALEGFDQGLIVDTGPAFGVEMGEQTIFPPVDDAEEFGEGTDVAEEPDSARLLDQAVSHGAQYDRWVNQGIVQDEYRDSCSDQPSGS